MSTIWLATMGNGVWKCDPKNNSYKNYSYKEGVDNSLSSNSSAPSCRTVKGIYGSLPTVAVYADIMKRRTTLPLSASKTAAGRCSLQHIGR